MMMRRMWTMRDLFVVRYENCTSVVLALSYSHSVMMRSLSIY